MISEAELIEIEGRAEGLADLTEDVLTTLADAIREGDNVRDAMAGIEAQVAACAADIERLVSLARSARRAA